MNDVRNLTSKGIYLIKGKFYNNVISCRQGSYYGNPVVKITFVKGLPLNYNPSDVEFHPFTRTVEGDFRIKDNSGKYYVATKIHIYGNNLAYGIESRKGYISYVRARDSKIES